MIKVFIDNNVWDYLFECALDLCVELPADEFSLWITRQGEFEIRNMPDHKRRFTHDTIVRCQVKTDLVFGFARTDVDGNPLPKHQQLNAGFSQGRLSTPEEGKVRDKTPLNCKKITGSGLHKHQADRELAARALKSVVLSCEKSGGPISKAFKSGHAVAYLGEYEERYKKDRMSLRQFVREKAWLLPSP